MIAKGYITPEISVLDIENTDIITTSNPTLGVETSSIESDNGIWEVIG